ncbi:MAG: T9SS type A sorting domain-containing protein, partial [Bacteroidota bacterium]
RTNAARLTVAVIMGYGTDDRGQALTETPTEVVRLRFTVVDPGRSPALAFSNVQAFTGPGEAYSLGAFEGLDAVPPVALASFEAAQSEGNVVLRWETLRESNNAAFVVERVVEYAGVMPAGIEALEGESAEAFTPITQVEGGGTRAEATQYVYTDTTLPFTARTARYRLRQVSVDGSATLAGVVEVAVGVPETFAVHPAFPNPVQGEATLRYELPEDGPVEIVVYDLLGRRVQVLLDEEQEAGRYEVRLDTRSLASGVYLYRVRAERERAVQKITVMR